MANSIYSTTMISNGGRDGRVLVQIIHLFKTLQHLRKWVVKEATILILNNYLLLDIVHALIALSLILSQNKISDANPEVEITIELQR